MGTVVLGTGIYNKRNFLDNGCVPFKKISIVLVNKFVGELFS